MADHALLSPVFFESLSAKLTLPLTTATLTLTTLSLTFGLLLWRSGESYRRLAVLGALSTSLITALYALPSSSSFVFPLLVFSALIAIVYAITWGFRDDSPHLSQRTCDLLAILVIACSTVIKLVELESWPPVLTDYAARTGVETISPPSNVTPGLWGVGQHAYLYGGGTSLLHSPLLSLVFNLFGYTTFAVRLTEVLGSICTLACAWLVLRTISSSHWNLVGLILLAFSAEHISQSRMGTFYSISQALGLCILWLWLSFERTKQSRGLWALGLMLATTLIPMGYAPTRALFVLTAAMILRALGQNYRERITLIYLCVMIVFSSGFTYVTLHRDSPFGGFGGRVVLATDSPVWFKNSTNIVSNDIQPITIALKNTGKNVKSLVSESLTSPTSMELPYQWAFLVLACLACIGVFRSRWRTISIFVLVGILPAVLTHPILRRYMLVRPLIPFIIALYFKEYILALLASIKSKVVRTSAATMICLMIGLLPIQGIYIFAKINGPVGTAPSFGPEYAEELIQHLRRIAGHASIAILSPSFGVYKYKMALADHLYGSNSSDFQITFPVVTNNSNPASLVDGQSPICLAILNESNRAWIVPWLRAKLPQLRFSAYEKHGKIMYWMACSNDYPA